MADTTEPALLFTLDEEGFQQFADSLDVPPVGKERLRRLLAIRPPWDEPSEVPRSEAPTRDSS